MLENLTHRGAVGADPLMGDGAGMLVQIPDAFFRDEMAAQGIELPTAGAICGRLSCSCRKMRRCARIAKTSSREVDRRRRPGADRLPRCAGGQCLAVQGPGHCRDRTVPPSGFHRPRRGHCVRRRFRAPPVHPPQGDFRPHLCRDTRTRQRFLYRVAVHRAPSSTRACSSPIRSAPTTRIWLIRALNRRWCWCISGFRPTHSRHGSWRIPTAWSPTTAKSTRCAATSTGWRRGRPRSIRAVRQRYLQALADFLRGPIGHGLLRQCARIPVPGRLFARPCDDDADPGSLGRQQADVAGAQGVLRISCRADGAMGRPCRGGLHRWPPDRRDAGPQRPASGALYRHR